jgi:hypothetical protein
MTFRDRLRQNPLLYALNARFKAHQLKFERQRLFRHYEGRCRQQGIRYAEADAVAAFRTRHRALCPAFSPKPTGTLNIFWVGASQAQDESGFLQSLRTFGKVVTFGQKAGSGYGPIFERAGDDWLAIRRLNDAALIQQVSAAHAAHGIDVLMGQMWAQQYSADTLRSIRALGIPVINIAMDDRLPVHWSTRDGYRLGSVGLGDGLDLALTTSAECCAWYAAEGIPALYWPLASDAQLFAAGDEASRDIDVLFVGNRYGIRAKLVEGLARLGVPVTCYGNGWPNGAVDAERNVALSRRARIILGIGTVGHCSDVYTLKLRDFDALMTGALYVTHRNPDLLDWFTEGVHLECYATLEELHGKLIHYLAHPAEREHVGRQGQDLARQRHTWTHRLTATFEQLGLTHGPVRVGEASGHGRTHLIAGF